MTESTADVYTREKRNVVVKVWHEVANNLSEILMEGWMVREDLSHPDWEGLPLAEPSPSKKSVKESLNLWTKTSQSSLLPRINHHLFWRRTTQVRSKRCLLYRKNRIALYPARHQRTNWALLTALFVWWHLQ